MNRNKTSIKNYLIYQAHTNQVLYYETICSIFSFGLHHDLNHINVIIYTDNPDFFEPYLNSLNIIYRKIDTGQIQEWMGARAFIHRMKIKVLQEVISNHQGNFLYVDSDTYFIRNLDDVFINVESGQLYMHCFENFMKNLKMYKPLNGYSVKLNSESHIISGDTPVWNAGALGFNNQASEIIDQALNLTDTLYEHYQKHIIEQFAFSYSFGANGPILPVENYIFHYWFLKELREYLNEIFTNPINKNTDILTKTIKAIKPTTFAEEKLKWRNRSGLHRAFKRLVGQDFKLPPLSTLLDQDQFLME